MNELPEQELQASSLSLVDGAGTVFFWRGRVLRAVRADAATTMRALLGSGLLQALTERGWIPPCHESTLRVQGFAFVIEQDRLPVVSYPYEWTYGMLRDAATRVLEVNLLAREFGWELKDCHGFNFVFDGPEPRWVDLGSFVPHPPSAQGWMAYEQFLQFYEYPLYIWSDGGGFIARRLVAASDTMSHADYGLYRWPWLRLGGADRYQRWLTLWHQQYRRLSRIPDDKIQERLRWPLGALVSGLKARGWLPGLDVSLERARCRTLRRRRRGPGSFWSNYQSQGATFVATPRFQRIIALARQFKVTSVIELGANQGWLSEELLRVGLVQFALCTDADEPAVDLAYERTKAAGGRLNTAVLDFVQPMTNPAGEPPAHRFRADAALCLAVSHHLLLTQRITVTRMLRSIALHSSRLVFVEFMPLGLWDGKIAPPVPAWYNLDWFRAAFRAEFDLRHEESLETNRHLFCGTLHGPVVGS